MEPRAEGEGSLSPQARATGGGDAGNRGIRRVGLLGGSFDPVHAGHLFVARTARERAGLDEVLFVPAARPRALA